MLFLTALAAMAIQGGGAWTWTLYEGQGPVVLANEIPDTPELRATLECAAGSGVAQVSVYHAPAQTGFANVSAGDSTATTEAMMGRDGKLTVALRTDHPVFDRFVSDGSLTVAVGDRNQSVQVDPPNLSKLRRFAELCSG